MAMQVHTLEQVSLSEITQTFNEAFAGYFIKLQFTEEGMAAKMKSEGINLCFSVGAFAGGRLVGFMLHGYDVLNGVPTVYNAGTGVVPAYRGRGITAALYRYCIPLLKTKGVRSHVLEVIDNNEPAIYIYEAAGFKRVRKFGAFKSTVTIEADSAFAIKEITQFPADLAAYTSLQPSWQNAAASIERDREGHRLLGAFTKNELMGYAAYVPYTGRIRQCAVHPRYRRMGVGKALFGCMQQQAPGGNLLVTNVDESYAPAIRFLNALGFQKILGLYEMKLEVNDA